MNEAIMGCLVALGICVFMIAALMVLEVRSSRQYSRSLQRQMNFLNAIGGLMYYGKKE